MLSYSRWKRSNLLTRSNYMFLWVPHVVAGGYAVASALWILLSDQALTTLAGDYSNYRYLQTLKGWFFISVSALLIYYVLKVAWTGILAAYEGALDSENRLQLALTSAGGGVWELDLTGNNASLLHISEEMRIRLGLPVDHKFSLDQLMERLHPDDVAETERRLGLAIASNGTSTYDMRYRLRTADGSYRWVHAKGNVVGSSSGPVQRMVGVALDIDDQVQAERAIEQLLRFDPVTGLSRQDKFLLDLEAALAGASSNKIVAVAQVKLLDLDHLIEDTETMDDSRLIRLVGDRLHTLNGVLVSRIAADVFAIANAEALSPSAALRTIRDALKTLLQPLEIGDHTIKLRVQTGGALSRQEGDTALGLLRNSGHAKEKADRTGDAKVHWFNEEVSDEFRTRNDRVRGLETAVANGEIECHFQPLVDLKTGNTSGFEALARWCRPGEGLIMPDMFISLAEELGKIAEIGEDILRQACRAAAGWPATRAFIAVNVSPLQLDDPEFPLIVKRVLEETGLAPDRLELEITETILLRDQETAIRRIRALREIGVQVAIDDFGTGYSSLALLSKMPFTRLKIDRSFVARCLEAPDNMIIVDTIISLAHNFGLSITAEGVETPEQVLMLQAKGVDVAQGYYFSKPIPAAIAADQVSRDWFPTEHQTRAERS